MDEIHWRHTFDVNVYLSPAWLADHSQSEARVILENHLVEDNHEILQVIEDETHKDLLIIEQPNKYKASNAQLKKEIFAI